MSDLKILKYEDLDETQQNTYQLVVAKQNLFIQGGAGSGKSTFIKYLEDNLNKSIVLCSPTGIAALNIGGTTIHSFFKLPISDYIDETTLTKRNRKTVNTILKAVDILILDEISMVRPDILDAIDILCKKARRKKDPFGGIQVILVGDLMQLPPIIGKNAEEFFIKKYNTKCPYFFDSNSYKNGNFQKVEFSKIYRQEDDTLLNNLTNLKNKKNLYNTVKYFNTCRFSDKEDLKYALTITPYRNVADEINLKRLNALPTPSKTYEAELEGSFTSEKVTNYPAAKELVLKKDALVMFIKNNGPLWVNGSTGIITNLSDNHIEVKLISSGNTVSVSRETWESREYITNTEFVEDEKTGELIVKDVVKEKITGTFKQFPLQLGYGITIHKCVHENTLVNIKNKGLIPIKNVIVDDEIQTGFGDYQKITYKSLPEIKKTLKITTNFGYSLDCSLDHPLLINRNNKNEWITADKLQLNDILCISRENLYNAGNNNLKQIDCNDKLNVKLPTKLNEDLSYLLGYLIGNGSQNDLIDYRIDIAIPVTNILNYIKKTINSFNLDLKVRKKIKTKNKDDIFNYFCYVCSKKFRLFLLENGLTTATAYSKHIPECIFKASSKNKAMFIRGLMDADGSVASNGIIRYVSMSNQLLNELQLILSTLGIGSYIKENTLHILKNDNKKFYDEIGFLYQKKLQRLMDYLKNKKYFKTNIDNNLIARDIVTRALPLLKEKFKNSRGKKGEGFAKYNKSMIRILFRKNKCELNNDHLKYLRYILNNENILDFNEEIDKNLKLNYLYDKIKSINIQEDSVMYDISVENHSAFIGNGIICHNCQGKTLDKVIIDLSRGAFAHGQAYVALSRTKHKEDMHLVTPITERDVIIDSHVLNFLNN